MTSLVDKIVAIEESLAAAAVPHAFGGALALAFHVEEPRATRDIDLNVFAPVEDAAPVCRALPAAVQCGDAAIERVVDDGQVRLFWDDTPLDLFFSTHRFHEYAEQHIEAVPFAGVMIPVLAAEPLAVFKAFFNRTRDWADIEAMLDVGAVDDHAVLGWLVDLLGTDDKRVLHFRALLDRGSHEAEPKFDP